MLTFDFKKRDSIIIGPLKGGEIVEVSIVTVDKDDSETRIGIAAPITVSVGRKEVFDAIKAAHRY